MQSIIRNVLLMAGTWIASQGFMSETEWEKVVGALIILAAAAWKFYKNRQYKKAQ
jgi:membrane associated rhomboid family serine protease